MIDYFLCFPAGTPIRTDKGLVPIQKIRIGDRVLSKNEHSGTLEYEKVTQLLPPHSSKLVKLRVSGETAALEPTPNHPFFARRAGQTNGTWIQAGQLQTGDQVLTAKSGWHTVLSVSAVNGKETVYNFEVDANHDYFAGRTGVLVHNGLCTVGRWMSPDELEAMQQSGQVQESFNNGVTSVTVPPDPAAYTNAPEGDVFAQFDVPTDSVHFIDPNTGWGKIFGPNNIPFGKFFGITEMPPATNITIP